MMHSFDICFVAVVSLGLLLDPNYAEETGARYHHVEDVVIAECSPGKYFWKEDSPHEFFACTFPINSDSSSNAAHLKCDHGTFMCHTGTQPFQPCHCKEILEKQSQDHGDRGQKVEGSNIFSSLLQLFQRSNQKMADRNEDLSQNPSVSKTNSSLEFGQTNLSDWRDVESTLSTLAPKVNQVGGHRKFAKQLDTSDSFSWSKGGCPNLFQQYNNSHMFQGVLRSLTSLDACKQGCLETRNCIGIDWNKLNNTEDSRRCFFVYPESTRYGLHPSMDYCCDHYRRTYCLSSPAAHYMQTVTTRSSIESGISSQRAEATKSADFAKSNISTETSQSSVMFTTTPDGLTMDNLSEMIVNQTSTMLPKPSDADADEILRGSLWLHNEQIPKSVEGYNHWSSQLSQLPGGESKDDTSDPKDETNTKSTLELLHGYLQMSKGAAHPANSEGPADSLESIPDSGCPFTFEKFVDRSHPFGKNVSKANSNPEQCKAWCLVRSFCLAVDFNFETRTCYFLREINPELLLVNAGVTHYRKTNCAPPLKCWKNAATRITNTADIRVTDWKTPSVDCLGVCYVRQTIGSSNVIERGCLANQTNGHGCFVEGAPGATYRSIMCICDTNRCNGLSVEALVSQVLYLPLDGDYKDHSGNGRHGNIPAGYTAPSFTCLDKAVNCSALFTGKQCIAIPTDQNFLTMVEVQDKNQQMQVPKATFVVFFKRVEMDAPKKQGIFGNSPSASIKATWAIFSDNMTNTSTAGVITDDSQLPTIDDFKYTTAADNSWHLAVLSYNGKNSPLPTLQYFIDGKEMLGNSRLENGMISMKDQPVTVGCVEGLNFVGFIDEVRIFSSVLDRLDIKALLMMQEANFW